MDTQVKYNTVQTHLFAKVKIHFQVAVRVITHTQVCVVAQKEQSIETAILVFLIAFLRAEILPSVHRRTVRQSVFSVRRPYVRVHI